MRVEPLSAQNLAQWDEFVRAHPYAAVGHLSAMSAVERATSHAESHSILAVDEQGRVAGVLPLFASVKRDLRVVQSRVLSTGTNFPSGPLVDAKLAAKTQQEVLETLTRGALDVAHKTRADRCVINYPTLIGDMPAIQRWGYYPLRSFGFHERNVVSSVVDMSPAEADLFSGLKSNCRNMVKRAAKDGGQFEVLTDVERWLACEDLSRQTLGDGAMSREAMRVLWDELVVPGYATVTTASLDGHPASAAVVVGMNLACYYWFGFNARPPKLTGANNFVLWQTMLTWRARGAKFFEVGSLEFSDDKLIKIAAFKESFGGTPFYCLAGSADLKPIKRRAIDLADAVVTGMRRRKPEADAEVKKPTS